MLGEVVGGDEGQDMRLQALRIIVVVDVDRGVLDRAAHPLGLAVGPGVIGVGHAVLDAPVNADPAVDAAAGGAVTLAMAILGSVGEGHAVVREHGVDFVGEDLLYGPEEGCDRPPSGGPD